MSATTLNRRAYVGPMTAKRLARMTDKQLREIGGARITHEITAMRTKRGKVSFYERRKVFDGPWGVWKRMKVEA